MKTYLTIICFVLVLTATLTKATAEDGYELWLRYPESSKDYRSQARKRFKSIVLAESPQNATVQAAVEELQKGFAEMFRKTLPTDKKVKKGALVLALSSQLKTLNLEAPQNMVALGDQGYLIRQVKSKGKNITLLTANSGLGLLYGSFALLQHLQLEKSLQGMDIQNTPRVQLRVLNHWDNLDRSVERGYSGQSIWDWWHLPDIIDPRYKDYARANASIGINGTVLNNVNAKADSLNARYIAKAAALANVFRPYGIRVYLSARFSAPIDIGGLDTADPLNPQVRLWWKNKATEIYQSIPDFGGFLVKANSEGQPGPQDYKRSHADGANMLAEALAPHGGVVMWRAFVYSEHDAEDRAKQAYNEFMPLDTEFAENVLVQVKNGPIDFQPREPIHPMFGAMKKTPLMLEFQITKEYLGFSTHLAFLAPLYEEVLQTDTHVNGTGSTMLKVVDGSMYKHKVSGIAGVANIGSARNWSGSIFDQANWYAFGRMAWEPNVKSEQIASEWLQLTFSLDETFVSQASDIMLRSREAVVDYMTPLGLAHLMDTGHHYGPGPWVSTLARPEWNPAYYHRATKEGIGFDRTATGSNAISQYAQPLESLYGDLNRVDDQLLLWFHHVPWTYKMRSGRSLWEALLSRYDNGVAEVERFQKQWQSLKTYVDKERHHAVAARLQVQLNEARWWRDASIAYFKSVSGLELPEGVKPPAHALEYYKSLEFPYAPGNG